MLQPRDIEIMLYIARHGVCTAAQLGRRFWGGLEVDPTTRYRRIEKLIAHGYLQRERTWYHGPHALTVTPHGLRTAKAPFRPLTLNWGRLRHQLAMVDLSEDLLTRDQGAWWLTERELRQQWLRDKAGGVHHERLPDGMLRWTEGRLVAVELELVPKRAPDYRRIGLAYLSELIHGIHAVWWFVRTPQIEASVHQHFGGAYAPNPFQVELWVHPSSGLS